MRSLSRFLLTVFCLTPLAGAVGFEVTPTRLTLNAAQPTDTLTLTNTASTPTTLQITLFAWSQVDGQDVLTPTQDAVAVPPVLTVAPGARQLVRVALRQRQDQPTERSYRLILQELPAPDPSPAVTGAAVLLRLSVPVFAPPRATSFFREQWTVTHTATGLTVTLLNQGNQHVQVKRLTLHTSMTSTPLLDQTVFGYALAGQRLQWTFPLPTVPVGQQLELSAETDRGVLRADLAVTP